MTKISKTGKCQHVEPDPSTAEQIHDKVDELTTLAKKYVAEKASLFLKSSFAALGLDASEFEVKFEQDTQRRRTDDYWKGER